MAIINSNACKLFTVALSSMLLAACVGGDGTAGNDSAGVIVNPANTGVATISWLPPTENTDGSSLNLAGYKIYYGTSANTMSHVITVQNPGISTYVVENLGQGMTYYFIVTAYDDNGIESSYSEVKGKTITS
jgi:fibronectin type 3 domain-containing protein